MTGRAQGIYKPRPRTQQLHRTIYQLWSQGLTQQQVALELHVSVEAVQYHLLNHCNCNKGKAT